MFRSETLTANQLVRLPYHVSLIAKLECRPAQPPSSSVQYGAQGTGSKQDKQASSLARRIARHAAVAHWQRLGGARETEKVHWVNRKRKDGVAFSCGFADQPSSETLSYPLSSRLPSAPPLFCLRPKVATVRAYGESPASRSAKCRESG